MKPRGVQAYSYIGQLQMACIDLLKASIEGTCGIASVVLSKYKYDGEFREKLREIEGRCVDILQDLYRLRYDVVRAEFEDE